VALLRLLVAWAAPVMLGGVALGFLAPPLAAAARPLLTALIVATLSVAVMRTDLATLAGALRRPLLPAAHVVWLLVVSPALMHLTLLAVPVDPALHGPLVLYAASAAITSMPAFALLFGLDATFVLIGVTAAALTSPLTVPAVAWLVMGDALPLGPGAMMVRMAAVIAGSYAIGIALRRLVGAGRIAGWKPQLDAFFVVAATLIGIAVMDGALALTLARPHAMAVAVAAVFGGSLVLVALATLLFRPAGLITALGAGLNSGPRNISIVLAVVGGAASDELVMLVAAAQLPIFAFPLFQRPLIRRLLARAAKPGVVPAAD
jgi:BASS family bile acid:Na+ symporter